MAAKRTVLITGCSDGSLGSALALAFHAANWRVFASARNLAKLEVVKNAGIECIQLDIQSEQSIIKAVQEVERLTDGSLDALINNAGIGGNMPVIHVDPATVRNYFELNVYSVITMSQAFFPLLLKSARSGRHPLLVNNTSGQALLGCGIPFQGAYAASKAAAGSITESLRIELAPFNIRVINLLTGVIRTNFTSMPEYKGAKLPPNSIYNLAKDAIEKTWNDNPDGKTEPADWAKQVVQDLSQTKPPYLVARGSQASLARFVTLLPTGLLDGTLKKMVGLDVLEKEIQKSGGLDNALKKM